MTTSYTVGERDQRPWGSWEIIALGPSYAVKRIVVRPGHRLSLQRHKFRAEHWTLVNGTGVVTRGRETFPIRSGEHTAIGRGDIHRVANPGPGDLVLIEVQHGERLDENDIERIEDDYDR